MRYKSQEGSEGVAGPSDNFLVPGMVSKTDYSLVDVRSYFLEVCAVAPGFLLDSFEL